MAGRRNFTDFVTVDGGASAHDAHLNAALADYDDEFTSLQLHASRRAVRRRLRLPWATFTE